MPSSSKATAPAASSSEAKALMAALGPVAKQLTVGGVSGWWAEGQPGAWGLGGVTHSPAF